MDRWIESIIVIIIVGSTAALLAWRAVNSKGKAGGCGGCTCNKLKQQSEKDESSHQKDEPQDD